VVGAARTDWSEIGPFGRVAFGGVLLSLVVAVVLGVWIPRQVRLHLLTSRAQLITSIGDEIADRGLVPVGAPGSESYERLADEISLTLLGGETVRVKLWTLDGTVSYSDDLRLVGRTFGLTPTARKALRGDASFSVSDLSEPAHAFERPLGRLIEFFVPVHDRAGAIIGIFEVEERVDSLETTLTNVRRNIWLAIGSGVAVLGVFMGSLTMSSARVLNRRRRQAERLLGSLFRAQEEERRRTVGALHDDVGQPLYRLLYGLEGSRAKLPSRHPVRQELEGLAELTRGIDRTLRGELRLLHQGIDDELGLAVLLRQVVETARAETGLHIDFEIGAVDTAGIGQASKVALVHAAREAITNVRKHAVASHVVVSVHGTPQEVTVTVTDDGVGVRSPEGLGLVTTRERLDALGGGLRVSDRRGGGTVFRATVPRVGGGG
jgi:signal transduction histidine kinase